VDDSVKVVIEMDIIADIDEEVLLDEEKFNFIEGLIEEGADRKYASVSIKSIEIKN